MYRVIYSMWFRFPMAMITSFGVAILLSEILPMPFSGIACTLYFFGSPLIIHAWLGDWPKPKEKEQDVLRYGTNKYKNEKIEA